MDLGIAQVIVGSDPTIGTSQINIHQPAPKRRREPTPTELLLTQVLSELRKIRMTLHAIETRPSWPVRLWRRIFK